MSSQSINSCHFETPFSDLSSMAERHDFPVYLSKVESFIEIVAHLLDIFVYLSLSLASSVIVCRFKAGHKRREGCINANNLNEYVWCLSGLVNYICVQVRHAGCDVHALIYTR